MSFQSLSVTSGRVHGATAVRTGASTRAIPAAIGRCEAFGVHQTNALHPTLSGNEGVRVEEPGWSDPYKVIHSLDACPELVEGLADGSVKPSPVRSPKGEPPPSSGPTAIRLQPERRGSDAPADPLARAPLPSCHAPAAHPREPAFGVFQTQLLARISGGSGSPQD